MSNMKDPTYDEMRALLVRASHDDYVYELEEAIYWYAHDYHGGQASNLYEALCRSPFKPGAYNTGLGDGAELDLYIMLQEEYGGA